MATSTAETHTAVNTTAAQRTRQLLFKEIVSTEQTYVQALTTLTNAYEQPLIQAAATADPILTQQQITVLFANARLLTTLHTNFLSALTTALSKSAELGGDEFIAFSPYFKMYTPYANNYAAATSLLSELTAPSNKKSHRFRKFIAKQPMSIQALLITPIQRIPRYRLLLEALIKHSDDTAVTGACDEWRKCLSLIESVAAHINEAVRTSECANVLMELQSQLNVGIVAPSRKYIFHSDALTIDSVGEMSMLLCNDIIVISRVTTVLDKKTSAPIKRYECVKQLHINGETMIFSARSPHIASLPERLWTSVNETHSRTQSVAHQSVVPLAHAQYASISEESADDSDASQPPSNSASLSSKKFFGKLFNSAHHAHKDSSAHSVVTADTFDNIGKTLTAQMEQSDDATAAERSFILVSSKSAYCVTANDNATLSSAHQRQEWLTAFVKALEPFKDGAFLRAAATNDEWMFDALSALNANVNASDSHGWTPTHYAANAADVSVTTRKLLAAADINFNARDKDGNTAMMIAVRTKHVAPFICIVSAAARSAACDVDWTAKANDGKTLADLLLAHSNDATLFTAFLSAITTDIAISTALVRAAAISGHHQLMVAMSTQDPAVMRPSLNAVDKRGLTPLLHAAIHGRTSVIEYICAAHQPSVDQSTLDRTDPETGNTALMMACAYGHAAIVTALLRFNSSKLQCAILNRNKQNAVQLADKHDDVQQIIRQYILRVKKTNYNLQTLIAPAPVTAPATPTTKRTAQIVPVTDGPTDYEGKASSRPLCR